jgi:plasmid stability protein
MKNVTIALDDEVHRQARIRAAELGTSLSALVKDYLNSLAAGAASPAGVREMPMPLKHAQPAKDGPPWLVDGKWVYTRDGKPRQPGALREKLKDLPDDWDEWSPEMLEFFEKLQNDPWDDDKYDPLP